MGFDAGGRLRLTSGASNSHALGVVFSERFAISQVGRSESVM